MDWFPACRDDWYQNWRCEQQRSLAGGDEKDGSCEQFRNRAAMCLAKVNQLVLNNHIIPNIERLS
jgi:hypothetical protein